MPQIEKVPCYIMSQYYSNFNSYKIIDNPKYFFNRVTVMKTFYSWINPESQVEKSTLNRKLIGEIPSNNVKVEFFTFNKQ